MFRPYGTNKTIRMLTEYKTGCPNYQTACFNIIPFDTISGRFSYNCGPATFNAIASSLSQYCSKLAIYFAPNCFAFTVQSASVG
jgi:hypothetical protein